MQADYLLNFEQIKINLKSIKNTHDSKFKKILRNLLSKIQKLNS